MWHEHHDDGGDVREICSRRNDIIVDLFEYCMPSVP